jgi:hypothetical protein
MSLPSRFGDAVFRVKVFLLQLRRAAQNAVSPLPRLSPAPDTSAFPFLLAEVRMPLWSNSDAGERWLQRGKVQNLRIAARSLHNLTLGAGEVFSFWRHIGRATRRRGYAEGRELREGCLIPSVGGGICQLSNALYEAALRAGFRIVERHAHSQVIAGSAAEAGRDATVFWNYRDLRFSPNQNVLLSVRLTADELVVGFRSESEKKALSEIPPSVKPRRFRLPLLVPIDHSCGTCEATGCFRHRTGAEESKGVTAFLVDAHSPEMASYIEAHRTSQDHLLLPLDGRKWRMSRYVWKTDGFARVSEARRETLLRSVSARRQLPPPKLRALHLRGEEQLAKSFARQLSYDATHLVIALPLLPYLWRDGHLGGRRFTVLLTRHPLPFLHSLLDEAAARNPEQALLRDFRAPESLVRWESEALANAEAVVTSHSDLLVHFGARAVFVPWAEPQAPPTWTPGLAIAFAGPTAARKGAYAVREAARRRGCSVVLRGAQREGADFWDGVQHRQATDLSDWLSGVCAVVQPAVVEETPRALLAALAAGVPVIASAACGLGKHPLLCTVPPNDSDALAEALARL